MTEDLISPESIPTIKPTKDLELNEDLNERIKNLHDDTNVNLLKSGIYINPDNPLNPFPENHLIAILPYSEDNRNLRKKALESIKSFEYEESVQNLALSLIAKEEEILNLIYTPETDNYEIEKFSRIHEDTHRMQEIRFGAISVMEKLKKIAAELDADNKTDDENCITSIESALKLTSFLELQAHQQSLATRALDEKNKKFHLHETVFDNGILFSLHAEGRPLLKNIYDTLKQGKMIDFDTGIVVPSQCLALLMLALENADLAEDVRTNKISYEKLHSDLADRMETLLNDPVKLLSAISSKDFSHKIEQNLQKSLNSSKTLLTELEK